MLCENCNQNEATFHYEANIYGEVNKVNLCAHCAKELGYTSVGKSDMSEYQDYIGSFLSNLLGEKTLRSDTGVKCEICGATANDIKQSGKVGCNHCYVTFSQLLMPFIRRIHGSAQHTGKAPAGADREIRHKKQLLKLREEMNAAVAAQAFERAAELRDEIAGLEKEGV